MTYDKRQLNEFIIKHFTDEELRILCAVEFRAVYDDFSDGWSKKRKVMELIGWCERNAEEQKLLTVLQRERPRPFRTAFGQAIVQAEAVTMPVGERNPRQIFISHAHQDAELAQRLAADLRANGWQTWIAPDSIQPGEQWVGAVNRGLDESGVFLVLLTPAAVNSNWVRKETDAAIILEQKGLILFFPLEVKNCQPPALWITKQWITFREAYDRGVNQLLSQLDKKHGDSNDKLDKHDLDSFVHPKTGKKMVRIPAGEYYHGNKQIVNSDEFWIDKTPVTNAEYKRFLDANPTYPVPRINPFGKITSLLNQHYIRRKDWRYQWNAHTRMYPYGMAEHPVVLVSLSDVIEYKKWAGLSLPEVWQWEMAARGPEGYKYPWGNNWNSSYCNVPGTGIKRTTPVGQFSPHGDSPFGCVDMMGNIWEYTSSTNGTYLLIVGGSFDLSCNGVADFNITIGYPNGDMGFRMIMPHSPFDVQ